MPAPPSPISPVSSTSPGAYARARVQALVEQGVIEQFTAVVNPEKVGMRISTYVDLKVDPHAIDQVAEELAACRKWSASIS